MLHSRRLRSTLFAGMVAALGATTSLAPARAQPASAPGDQGPPNILFVLVDDMGRSEEHTSELQSLMRISYAVFCLKKKTQQTTNHSQYDDNRRQNHSSTIVKPHIL